MGGEGSRGNEAWQHLAFKFEMMSQMTAGTVMNDVPFFNPSPGYECGSEMYDNPHNQDASDEISRQQWLRGKRIKEMRKNASLAT